MARSWRDGCWIWLGSYLVSGAIVPTCLTLTTFGLPVLAQITPDSTLGSERSVVTPRSNLRGASGILIEGGAVRGTNLFQSFSDFNVQGGQRVYFANPMGIANILSRVTGSNPSNILGTLGVNGSANLFLLNPNGIAFGPNARLDIAGSFLASTADRLVFNNGTQFSATNPEAPPLLTVSLHPGLQYGTFRGPITNAGSLAVSNGQTLTLSGSTVNVTGSLTAPSGVVQVLGDRVALLDNARIDVSGTGGGGTVLLGGDYQGRGQVPHAQQTFVDKNVSVNADAVSNGNGGRVIVWANGSTQFYGNVSAQGGSTSGNGGFVEVSGKQNLDFNGQVNASAPEGQLGTLLLDPVDFVIDASNVDSFNGAVADKQVQANNNISFNADVKTAGGGIIATAGNNIFVNNSITTNSGQVRLIAEKGNASIGNGVQIDTSNVSGFAGNVEISAGNQVSMKNTTIDARSNALNDGSSPFTTIKISGNSVLLNQVYISTTNINSGYAGDIAITARDRVEILNSKGPRIPLPSGVLVPQKPGIFSQGNFGRILIGQSDYFSYSPKVVRIDNSQIVTNNVSVTGSSSTSIPAGNISIQATDSVFLLNGASLVSDTYRQGNAGTITIQTPGSVSLSGGSSIATDAYPEAQGNAGGVGIQAGGLSLVEDSQISTSTFIDSTNTYNPDSRSNGPNDISGSFAGAVLLFIDGDATLDNSRIFNNLENGASGTAGLVFVLAKSLSLLNGGEIQTLVRGNQDNAKPANGTAGNILIGVDQTLKIIGANSSGNPSAIFSSVEEGASGQAGNVVIGGVTNDRAQSIQIRNGAGISVRNAGTAATDKAGDVSVAARAIWIDDNSVILAESKSGQGGSISLDTDAVILGRSGLITATAGVDGTPGSGGDIAIGTGNQIQAPGRSPNGQLVFAPAFDSSTLIVAGKTSSDNNVLAQAFTGTGGNIRINASSLQDIAQRPDLVTRNDISTASSAGVDGTVVANTLNIFPSLKANPLPARYEVPRVAEGCDPRVRQETSRFVVTGRGGVAANPGEVLNQDTIAGTSSQTPTSGIPVSPNEANAIIPAQGLIQDANGKIRLTAYVTDPTAPVTPYPLLRRTPACHAP